MPVPRTPLGRERKQHVACGLRRGGTSRQRRGVLVWPRGGGGSGGGSSCSCSWGVRMGGASPVVINFVVVALAADVAAES